MEDHRHGILEARVFTVQSWDRRTNKFHHRRSGATRGEQRGLWTQRALGITGEEVRESFPGMVPQMASPLTCTIPEILLEGCQEPCLQAAPASQRVPCCPMQCLQSQTHLPPRLILIRALHPTLQDSCRGLPSMAGSAKKPTQNSFVRASLGQATQPRVPQPSLSNHGPSRPRLSCSLFRSKESDLPGGKLEA